MSCKSFFKPTQASILLESEFKTTTQQARRCSFFLVFAPPLHTRFDAFPIGILGIEYIDFDLKLLGEVQFNSAAPHASSAFSLTMKSGRHQERYRMPTRHLNFKTKQIMKESVDVSKSDTFASVLVSVYYLRNGRLTFPVTFYVFVFASHAAINSSSRSGRRKRNDVKGRR